MAGDALEKFKMSVNRGITTIGVKTSASLERSKILTHIDSLEKDNKRAYALLGEEAYELWESGAEDFSRLVDKFELIKKRKKDIEELTEELNSIEDKSNEILGRTDAGQSGTEAVAGAEANAEAPARVFCSQCGEGYDIPVKFCRKCGNKMS
ncbi:MAG: zinc ribbon domain-containing protein [Lachnospiraceae bacterium]|nr:zinc ribbon domain-containing protein [Lachnospiraceae bacterium]